MNKFHGCYPTMITPFRENGEVDYDAAGSLVDWYIEKHADGIFAVCQSSEMFFLTKEEQLKLARTVVERADGRIPVVVSGHIEDDIDEGIEGLARMAETGADAVVLVSNRIAGKDEGEDVFVKNAEKIFSQLPNVTFGLYECPYPYLRLLSDEFLSYAAKEGKLHFLKDVSCSQAKEAARAGIVRGSGLSLFNANTSTLLGSLQAGYSGYNGVMANFHIDLYSWFYRNFSKEPETAAELQDFLTLAAVIEARAYPISAKWYQNEYGVKMTLHTRSKDPSLFNENGRHEIEALKRMEDKWRERLGL